AAGTAGSYCRCRTRGGARSPRRPTPRTPAGSCRRRAWSWGDVPGEGARRPLPRRASSRAEALDGLGRILTADLRQHLVEPSGVGLLRLGQRLEPLGQLGEPLLARGLGHARVHLRVLVGLAGRGGLEVQLGLAHRLAGGGIADFLEEVEMAECVPRLGLGGVAEEAGDVGKALDVGHPREVQIAAVGLRLARERVLQIRETLAALEAWTC